MKIKTLGMEREVEDFYTKTVTKFGNGAKIDCFKKYVGKKVVIMVIEER